MRKHRREAQTRKHLKKAHSSPRTLPNVSLSSYSASQRKSGDCAPEIELQIPREASPPQRENANTMSLTERIQKELTAAMKEKDELRLSVLRMVKTALKNKEIEKIRPLEDLEALQVLQTLVKQRRESVEQFTKGGRRDLADKETKEIAIIETYLPAAPTDAEIHSAVESAIAEAGADSLKQMGAVIKAARARLEGKTVDGKLLSDKVRERLSKPS